MNFRERLSGMNNHYRYYSLEKFFESLQRNDIHYAELWTGPMHFYVDDDKHDSIDMLKGFQEKYDVKIIGICPEQTNPKPNNVAGKKRVNDIFKYYQQMIDIAHGIGCPQVLITSGWAFYDENKDEAWHRSVEMIKKICDYAKSKEIYLAMEALQPDESILVNNVRDLYRFKKEVGRNNLKICIDFGAMARAQDTIFDYFNEFQDDIVHIHFVDGAPCGHLAWGDGKRNLMQDLKDLEICGYHGYLSLETATSRYFDKPWQAEEKTIQRFKEVYKED